jgi:hypothetical protein
MKFKTCEDAGRIRKETKELSIDMMKCNLEAGMLVQITCDLIGGRLPAYSCIATS